MRRKGITAALLPGSKNFELVTVEDIDNNTVTVKLHDKVMSFEYSLEQQGKWCVSGYLDFRNARLLNALKK